MDRVEVYGTLGPACIDVETLFRMFEAGMTGVRLNLSHKGLKECKDWIDNLDMAAKKSRVKRNLLIDLQGPELRIGSLEENLLLSENDELVLDDSFVPIEVLKAIDEGDEILLDDGKILIKAESINKNKALDELEIQTIVLRGGLLESRKSLKIIGKEISLPTLTDADFSNIALTNAYNVTGVMLPFTRGKEDIINLRNALNENGAGNVRIFAKIENETGIDKLQEIIEYCDEIVIARGDLGNAVGLTKLPFVQEQIAVECKKHGRDFMVVTQMLNSMIENEVPTRAEVNDIYLSTKQGASSVMLTAETAMGNHPVEAIKVMSEVVKYAMK